jgi:hypothetical protein
MKWSIASNFFLLRREMKNDRQKKKEKRFTEGAYLEHSHGAQKGDVESWTFQATRQSCTAVRY